VACAASIGTPSWRSSNRRQLAVLHGGSAFAFTGQLFLIAAAQVCVMVLVIFHLTERHPEVSESLRSWQVLADFVRAPTTRVRQVLSLDDRVAVLAALLKTFHGP
jgi:hypothetical protein